MRTSRLDGERWHHLIRGTVLVRTTPAAFAISGGGALTCLQGLLTNDLDTPGENSLVYGALLTPKGAIVVDYWVLRLPDQFLLLAEPAGLAPSLELFRRSLPPRLARMENRTGQLHLLWLFGERVGQTLDRAGLHLPEHGRVMSAGEVHVARPQASAPFRALIVGETAAIEDVGARLMSHGAVAGEEEDRAAAEVLAGWPHLGHEIEERTLVQEVRYDEIGGVSYTKGCYTGQETVARLHFRGHTNRELKGLVLEEGKLPAGEVVTDVEGKEIGTVSSLLVLPDRTVGLGLVRRSIEAGSRVTAGGASATITSLPFEPARW
jgi:tRNA-modifying protein YgfZ